MSIFGMVDPMDTSQPFPQEHCCHCGQDGELVWPKPGVTGFRWRCRRCGVGWVTEGSAMDAVNEMLWLAREDEFVGHEDSERFV